MSTQTFKNIETFRNLHIAGGEVVRVPQDLKDYNFGSKDPDNKYCPFQWDMTKLPAYKDLRPFNSARHDQLSYGSCVGQGYAKTLEIMFRQHATPVEISQMFIYYNARRRYSEALGIPISDSGSSIFLAAGELTKRGACTETLWPYGNVNTEPSAEAYADGLTRLIGRYERCGTQTFNLNTGEGVSRDMIKDVKVAINCGMPVVFGVGLTSAFYGITGPMSTHIAQYNPTIHVNEYTPGYIGGHCMAVVGYDDAGGYFIVENSWGPEWGDNGYLGLSYQSLRGTAFDVFAIRQLNDTIFTIPDDYYIWDAKQRVVSWDIDGPHGQVYRLYQTAFNRRPDWDGLGYWIYQVDHGMTLEQVAGSFAQSSEYQSLFGNTTNREFVRMLYLLALYREPDQGGWDWHTSLLDNGTLTRGQTMIGFSESQENKDNCAIRMVEGIKYYPYTP
jgi:hypothetical protein